MHANTARHPKLKAAALLLGLIALLVSNPAAAGAEHRDSHAGGEARAAEVTEDNDNNDGGTPNNVADDGDNRHPSGKDRSVESGRSGNQGASTSDPDGDSNGGPDKPGGSGGVDKADQDGNNGCGNDDDFEDDNKGKCLGRLKQVEGDEPEPVQPSGSAGSSIADSLIEVNEHDIVSSGTSLQMMGGGGPATLGSAIARASAADPVGTATGGNAARVLGVQIARGALAATGSFAGFLVTLALGLLLVGGLLRFRTRHLHDLP